LVTTTKSEISCRLQLGKIPVADVAKAENRRPPAREQDWWRGRGMTIGREKKTRQRKRKTQEAIHILPEDTYERPKLGSIALRFFSRLDGRGR
jgi:hypothetical protein